MTAAHPLHAAKHATVRAATRVAMLALTLALALAMPRLAAAQLLSPGPLITGHASIDTDDDCGKCHQSGKQVVASLCLACHKDLGGAIAAGRGLHGRSYKGKPCEDCHVEHLGRKGKLVRWPGGAMEKLDHALTGYPLEAKHAQVKCLKCHTRTSPLGKAVFLDTKTTCAGCHKDPHAGRFGTGCQSCHAVSKDWPDFDHKALDHKTTRFALTGKHAQVACEKCHTGSPPKWKPLEFATCESCHKDPHDGQFRPKACTACHDTGGWESGASKMRSNHPWLSLANGHARVDCKTCHDRGNDRAPSRGKTCVACHKAVHLADFGTKCESCHASIKWTGLSEQVGRDHHPKTRYPLEGDHRKVPCASCPPASKPAPRRFRDLQFAACNACHADRHDGEFAARKQGECAQCHTVAGFAPTTFGVTAHATTAFPLEGRHVATPCGACHLGKRPRLDLRVAKKTCAECHDNPHGEQFAAEMQKGGCAVCHSAADWSQSRIDHTSWPLAGAHAKAACARCHGVKDKGSQPAAYRGIPRDCEGCHDDVHAAQFTQTSPARACKDCHGIETFRIARSFDHGTTRYALAGKHRALTCDACHRAETLRNGSSAVRWRLGYLQCKDCHANPHQEAP